MGKDPKVSRNHLVLPCGQAQFSARGAELPTHSLVGSTEQSGKCLVQAAL